MISIPLLLAALAVVLAWPVPVLLSRSRWPVRSPFTAMVLWQAIALAGGLSMIGALLVYGLAPLGPNLLQSTSELWRVITENRSAESLGLLHVFALSTAGLLGTHLVFTLLLTYVRIQHQRRRHRSRLDLLSFPSEEGPGTVVISHPVPVAYCLPGGGKSVTVLSDGLLDMLSADELNAVMAHERAHLAQRHHLLLWTFAAWRSALPWLPTSQLALASVNSLVEMLADDAALLRIERASLVRAIAIVASGQAPPSGVGNGEVLKPLADPVLDRDPESIPELESTADRLRRLLTPQKPLPAMTRYASLAGSIALTLAPAVLLVVPGLW